jgi:hypothetical protein
MLSFLHSYTVHEGVRRLLRRLADSPGRFERSESRASGTESNSNNPLGVPESGNIRHKPLRNGNFQCAHIADDSVHSPRIHFDSPFNI